MNLLKTFVQVRVNNNLKRDAMEVLDAMGMDMPTAIRGYLQRIVAEKGLPFDARIPDVNEEKATLDYGKLKTTEYMQVSATAVYISTVPVKVVEWKEYYVALLLVPVGKITRYEDIIAFLEKKYDAKTIEINWSLRFLGTTDIKYPVWRIVLTREMLQEDKFFMSRKEQKRRLENEGLNML